MMMRQSRKFTWTGVLFAGMLVPASGSAQTTLTTTTESGVTTTTTQQPPTGVEIEVGLGSRLGRQVSNYQSNNGILSLTNLGRATPQLLTGLGFSFCETGGTSTSVSVPMSDAANVSDTASDTRKPAFFKTTASTLDGRHSPFCSNSLGKRLGLFVSVQFGAGSNQTVTGYSIGGTVALGQHLRFLAGFMETPVSQISPGFANTAAQYVKSNPGLFPGVNYTDLAKDAYGAFDGIQTTSTAPAAGSPPAPIVYYPGPITETHYHGGLMVGVSLPVNIYNLFGGNHK